MTGETFPADEHPEPPTYTEGQHVRVYVKRDGERIAEDDWEYRMHRLEDNHVISARQQHEGEPTQYNETPKPDFDEWQKEKVAIEVGKAATRLTSETTNEAANIIEEEETIDREALAQELGSWGHFENAKYILDADPDKLALLIRVPAEVIVAGAEKGFAPEYLLSARDNGFTANRLREAGVNWGAPLPKEILDESPSKPLPPLRLAAKFSKAPSDLEELAPAELAEFLDKTGYPTKEDYMEAYRTEREKYSKEVDQHLEKIKISESGDPMMYLEAQGLRRKMKVEDIANDIESRPSEVKRELKRPGAIPLLHAIPLVGRRASWLVLARSMHRKELGVRRGKGLGKNHEDGLLRFGIPRTKEYYEYIKQQDENIRVLRNKLTVLNRHEYKGPERRAARRDLAELIHRAQVDSEALREHREVLHPSVYKHADFSPVYGTYKKSKG